MSNNSYKSIFKATTLFAGVQGINILLNLLRTKLVAIYLGPDGVGLNAIYNETKELIHETTNCGMDQSGVRNISIAHEEMQGTGDNKNLLDSIKLTRSLVALLALAGTLMCIIFSYSLSLMTFSDTEHVWGYICIAPAVGMSTIICGEMTILKGSRMIKKIAGLSTVTIIVGILTNIPLYYLYGMEGVIPAILLFNVVQMLVVMRYSYKEFPPQLCFKRSFLRAGKAMLILGGAFVLQGFMAHGARLSIQSYINNHGQLADVGLFNSTTLIITMYLGIFTSSLTADFFPRLSGCFSDLKERRLVICRQVDVLQIFTAPMLVAFLLGIHIIVPLLLSDKFTPIIPVLELALITCLVRSIAIPLQYLPLAAGDSKTYLFVDFVAYAFMVTIYVSCYNLWGLIGLGYGICAFNVIDLLWAMVYAKFKYDILPNMRNMVFYVLQTILLVGAFFVATQLTDWAYWGVGTILFLVSAAISLYLFQITRKES